MIEHLFDRLFHLSNEPALLGMAVFIHSTVVLAAGLAGLKVFQLRGMSAGARSFFLRICLCAVLATPITASLASFYHVPRFHITTPFPEKIPPKESLIIKTPAFYPGEQPTPSVQKPSLSRRVSAVTGSESTFPDHVAPAKRGHIRSGIVGFLTKFGALLFVGVWAFLSIFIAFRAVIISLYFRQLHSYSEPAEKSHVKLCGKVADELGIPAPRVLMNPYVTSTFLIGIFHPTILIPYGDNSNRMAAREVFLHELAHVVRRDHIWLYIGHIAAILFPLQPLIWILIRRIEETNDFACDDFVLRHTTTQRSYAQQLFDLARSFQSGSLHTFAGVGIFSTKTLIRRRIEHILNNSLARHISPNANESISFILLFLCTLTFTGLVDVHGKTFAQIQKIPETISRKAAAAAIATVTMVKERVEVSFAPRQKEQAADRKTIPITETVSGSGETTAVSQGTIPSPVDTAGVNPVETASASLTLHQTAPAEAVPVADPSPAAESVASGSSAGTTPIADTQSQKKDSALARTLPPSLLDLHSAATNRREFVAAKPGHVEVSIPEGLTATLKASLEQGQENPVWSPSGEIIAFTGYRGVGVWAVPVQGGKPVLIHDNSGDISPSVSASPRGTARTLCFTPDGRGITFLKYIPESSLSGTKKQAVAVDTKIVPVIETVNLLNGQRQVIVENASDGCWSPDGKYFVYVDDNSYGINVLDLSTGNRRKVSAAGRAPTITPDGSLIIYVDWGFNNTEQLFKVSIAGDEPVQLTFDGYWRKPVCSPDGEWVLSTGKVLTVGTYSLLRAYNLKLNQAYDIYKSTNNTTEMGNWSPSGRQYCYAILGSNSVNEKNTLKSSMEIGDFNLPSLAQHTTGASEQPLEFKLIGNFPNPFNPSTTIQFSLPTDGFTELVIYSMNGQKIRELVSGSFQRGIHSVMWDGRDQQGNPVSSGVYISRLKMEGKVETRRMTLVK